MLLHALLKRFDPRMAGNSATIGRLHLSLLSAIIASYCLAAVIINSSGTPLSLWPLADASTRACCRTECFAVHSRLSVQSSQSLA